jgi:hypothetical protein
MLSKHRLIAGLYLSFGLLVAQVSLATHEEPRHSASTDKEALAEIAVGAVFGEQERRILGDYLRIKREVDGRERDGDRYRHDRDYDRDRHDWDRDEHYYDDDSRRAKKGPGKPKKLPPGLRKKLERGGELPPGWQKKVVRGEVLDEHLYRRSHYLPRDILRRMPEIEGTSLRQIDDRVLRVQDATRTILDIFYLVDQL